MTKPKIVCMPLANRTEKVTIYADDLERLQVDYGLSLNWCLNSDGKGHSYVRAGRLKNRGRVNGDVGGAYPMLFVARVLLGAERGERVQYIDGNHLNLCRDNLRLEGRHPSKNVLNTLKPEQLHDAERGSNARRAGRAKSHA